MNLFCAFGIPAALTLLSTPSSAQAYLYQYDATSAGSAGDLDGDGTEDFVIAYNTLSGSSYTDLVEVHSGATGALLLTIPSPYPGEAFGNETFSPGDVNGDGIPDLLITGGYWENFMVLVSGSDGSVLWSVFENLPVWRLDIVLHSDIDGDGIRDLIRTPDTHSGMPKSLVSGATGVVLSLLPGGVGFGDVGASAGDWDGDGIDDMFLGDPEYMGGTGRVTIHSLPSGALIGSFSSPVIGGRFGDGLVSAGDTDGDGVEDLYVSAPDWYGPSVQHPGAVFLISGATGNTLTTMQPQLVENWIGQEYGDQIRVVSDLDGDGTADVLVHGAWGIGGGGGGGTYVRHHPWQAHSGATGAYLHDAFNGRVQVTLFSDIDGDGRRDYLLGFDVSNWSAALIPGGLVLANWDAPVRWANQSGVCTEWGWPSACVGLLGYSGAASLTLGSELTLHVSHVPAHAVGIFVRGDGNTAAPFGSPGLCTGAVTHRMAIAQAGGDLGSYCPTRRGSLNQTVSKAELGSFGLAPGSLFGVSFLFRDPAASTTNFMGATSSVLFTMLP